MRVGICTMEDFDNRKLNTVGSSRIRGRWLVNYWPAAEMYKIGREYDVLIFQKVYWENMKRRFEGIKILDICDPDWLEGRQVVKFANLCDAVVTSTPALADYIRQFLTIPVVCIPDRLDLKEFKPKVRTFKGPIRRVTWFGYHQNFDYLTNALPFLIDNNVELIVISDMAYPIPGGLREAKVENIQYKQSTLYDDLARGDAVFLPDPKTMKIDAKGRYKSNNKTIQAWALGLPVIQSPDDFDRLNDPAERRQEVERRLIEVKEKYDVKLSVREYKELIGQLGGDRI